jgi:hypothetical protein
MGNGPLLNTVVNLMAPENRSGTTIRGERYANNTARTTLTRCGSGGMNHDSIGPRGILTGTVLAPLMAGAAYAAAHNLPGEWLGSGAYLQSPLTLSFFSGLIIAFACRPVLLRIPWSRGVALILVLAILLGGGPAAGWCLAWLIDLLGLAPFPYILPRSILPNVLGALAIGGVMVVMFRPGGGDVDLASLRARLKQRTAGSWAMRLAAMAGLAVVLWLVAGWIEALWAGTHPRNFTPVITPNLWIQVTSGGFEPGGATMATVEAGGVAAIARGVSLLGLYALRALTLFLPLVPISLVLRGKWLQITAVFVLLLFIVGDFAPLIMDQPYPSTRWLLLRTATGAIQALLLGGAAARLIGQTPD